MNDLKTALKTRAAPPLPGWLGPFVVAALAWNLIAVLGAMADYGDTRHAASHASFARTLLHFMLQYLPLTALSLLLALGFERAELAWPRPAQLVGAYLAALLVFLPLLGSWQSAVNHLFGKAWVSPLVLLAQQSLLTWWFYALLLTVAFGAHLAYSTWRHAHVQTLAWQHAQQVNLSLRLRLLQGQLEPYFLSSSLAGIGKLIRAEQRGAATRALARLSDLLRYALRASQSDWQSVADEIQFLRDYVEMQSMCYGTALQVDWQLEPRDWADYRCPPLLLFPLLEQALGGCREGGMAIRVGVADALRVQVDVCYRHGTGGRDGLDGLRERLAMLYAGEAGLSSRTDGQLTQLQLAYPVVRHDD
jgi:two-component system sensor histidine kinase AlgZ